MPPARQCPFTGLDALAEEPRFATVRGRAEHADAILPALHAPLGLRTAVEWEALMRGQVPCAVVGGIEDMFDHPQVQAEGLVARLEGHRALASPFRFGDAPRRVPTCGAPGAGPNRTTG